LPDKNNPNIYLIIPFFSHPLSLILYTVQYIEADISVPDKNNPNVYLIFLSSLITKEKIISEVLTEAKKGCGFAPWRLSTVQVMIKWFICRQITLDD
jgi:hypothetical protein